MKFSKLVTLFTVVLLMSVITGAGCSDESETKKRSGVVKEVTDSLASAVVENLIRATPAAAIVQEDTVVETAAAEVAADPVYNDMLIIDSTIYATYDAGVLVYDLQSDNSFVIPSDQPLNAVAFHAGFVYVGGNGLYQVVESGLEPVDVELSNVITDLYSYDYHLMIGTESGLYSMSIFGFERLFDDVTIRAMVRDNDGLWVATDGHGLYRWDNREFKQRYLMRETSIFNHVTTLDFNHNHLYVGTGEAMYIFDGGRWQTITTENGLPSDDINAIDASNWVVYVATSNGVASFFNDEVTPINKLDDVSADVMGVIGRSIIVGTTDGRLLKKTGPVLTTLVESPDKQRKDQVAVSIH